MTLICLGASALTLIRTLMSEVGTVHSSWCLLQSDTLRLFAWQPKKSQTSTQRNKDAFCSWNVWFMIQTCRLRQFLLIQEKACGGDGPDTPETWVTEPGRRWTHNCRACFLSVPGKGQPTTDVQAQEGSWLWSCGVNSQHQLQFSGPPEPKLHLSLTEIQVRHKINPPATFKWLSSYFQWKHSGLAMPTKSSVAPLFALCKIFLDSWCLHLCVSGFHYDCWPSEARPRSFHSYDRNSSMRKS